MNGWFPKINLDGLIGSGDTSVWVDGAEVAPVGGYVAWAGRMLIYNDRQKRTQVGWITIPKDYSERVGSDDTRWAGGFYTPNEARIDLYDGTTLTRTIEGGCEPRFAPGEFAFLHPYNKDYRALILNDVVVERGAIMTFVLGAGTIAWMVATSVHGRAILTREGPAQIRDDEVPIALFTAPDGQPWLVTNTHVGTFVRPLRSPFGYLIAPALYNPDARMSGARLRVVGSDERGAPHFDHWIDFAAPRVDLRLGTQPIPVPTPPPPPASPSPKDEPMSEQLPSHVVASITRFIAKWPVPSGGPSPADEAFETRCRFYMTGLASQVRFDTQDERWGVKSAGGGRPQSKDSLTFNGPRLINYDLLLGVGTGSPTLNINAVGEDITGQVFMPVAPIDNVGGVLDKPAGPIVNQPPPVVVPPQPTVPTPTVPDYSARLGAIEAALIEISAGLSALKQAPPVAAPVTFPDYTASNRLLGTITLRPVK